MELRPGELVAVKRAHLRLLCDGLGFDGVPRAVVCIVKGKTRHRAARTQGVIIHEAEVVHALEGLLAGVSPNDHVVPRAAAGLRVSCSGGCTSRASPTRRRRSGRVVRFTTSARRVALVRT
jgi:hypothetical protein